MPNDLKRVSKLIRNIESLDPKLLGEIAKVENSEGLKSDFEAMAAHIFPYDHVANNKAYLNKNKKHNVSDSGIVSMVRDRYQKNKLDLRFYNFGEQKPLSDNDKHVLHEWQLSHPTDFGQSEKRSLDEKQGNVNHQKRKKKHHINDQIKAQIQKATDKFINTRLKNIDSVDAKRYHSK